MDTPTKTRFESIEQRLLSEFEGIKQRLSELEAVKQGLSELAAIKQGLSELEARLSKFEEHPADDKKAEADRCKE